MIAKEGATVVIWARDEKNLEKVSREIKYEGGKKKKQFLKTNSNRKMSYIFSRCW